MKTEEMNNKYRVARYFDDTWEAWVSEPTTKEEAERILKDFKAGHYVTYDVRIVR